jgi:chromosome segregation ATPase
MTDAKATLTDDQHAQFNSAMNVLRTIENFLRDFKGVGDVIRAAATAQQMVKELTAPAEALRAEIAELTGKKEVLTREVAEFTREHAQVAAQLAEQRASLSALQDRLGAMLQ